MWDGWHHVAMLPFASYAMNGGSATAGRRSYKYPGAGDGRALARGLARYVVWACFWARFWWFLQRAQRCVVRLG